MNPSLPTPLPPPTEGGKPLAEYAVLPNLALFHGYTPESWLAERGTPLVYRKGEPLHNWCDESQSVHPTRIYNKLGADSQGNPVMDVFTVPAAFVLTPNLPVGPVYPPYTPAATVANINPDYICSEADARAIFAELSALPGCTGRDLNEDEVGISVTWGTETRRRWCFFLNVVFENAPPKEFYLICEYIISDKNHGGVGRPGHWSLTNTQLGPQFVPDDLIPLPVPGEKVESLPMPLRDPVPGESFVLVAAGTAVMVQYTPPVG